MIARRTLQGFAVGALGCLLAASLRFALHEALEDRAPFLLFVPPVMLAAWYGGLRPGLLTTAMGALLGLLFFIPPWHSLHVEEVAQALDTALFLAVGASISLLCEALRAARRRADQRQQSLQREVAERLQAEEALKQADRRKDEFLATLSHELRNPLSPITYGLHVWPTIRGEPDEMERLREMFERQVRQLNRLIDDLLDVSRITRGKIQLRPQDVPLDGVIAGAVEMIRPLLGAREHQLQVTLPDEPVIVTADAARLTQVLANILGNAAKYTQLHGQIHLTVDRLPQRVVIRIRDNGPGIPQNMLSEIFEMFRQVDGTLDRSGGGLGIGLTLVKQLVELHGGTVEAHSDGLGTGSEFVVNLPALASVPIDRTCRQTSPAQPIGNPSDPLSVGDRPSVTTAAHRA